MLPALDLHMVYSVAQPSVIMHIRVMNDNQVQVRMLLKTMQVGEGGALRSLKDFP